MNFVYPIRDEKHLFALLHFLKDWNRNYYIAAAIGINWGLRCSDILALTLEDVIAGSGARIQIRTEIRLVEIKNHHERIIPISDNMRTVLREHISWLGYPAIPIESPLIMSRNFKYTENGTAQLKPLSRKRLWTAISFAAQELGFADNLGTHSLRKTYVWQAWKRGESLDIIRKELGHSSVEYTERYAAIPLSFSRGVYEKVNFSLPPTPKTKRGKRSNGTQSKRR